MSLVLPDAATSIKAGSSSGSTFSKFTALTSVSGSAVETIDSYAFASCAALTTVSLPAAISIGYDAFASCAALTTVSLPAATDIGDYAFYDCDALTTVNIPAATSIGQKAFASCAALTEVSLPAATSIGFSAFSDTGTSDLIVTLGSTAPTLGASMFSSINDAKTVTVKVPSNATEYGTLPSTYSGEDETVNWGNGFRGKGWNGSAFTSGSINSNITLTIQAE